MIQFSAHIRCSNASLLLSTPFVQKLEMAEALKSETLLGAESATSRVDAGAYSAARVHSEVHKIPAPARSHYNSVQAMRAFSVIAVVLFHVAMRQREDFPHSGLGLTYPLSLMGHAGVDLFFIISGFIITSVNWNEFGNLSEIRSYLLKRFIRVYPLYWLTALFMLPVAISQHLDLKSGLGALLLLPHYASRINQVAWSLGYEILFYGIFALFLIFPRRALPICVSTWLLLILANSTVPQFSTHLALVQNFVRPLNLEFVFGIAIALLINGKLIFSRPRLLISLGIIGILLAAGLKHYAPNPYPEYYGHVRAMIFGLPCALILYGAITLECLRKSTYPKLLLLIGDASYSIYLVHFAVIQLMMLNPFAKSIEQPWVLLAWELFVITAALATGVAVHLRLEKPILRGLKHRLLDSRSQGS